MDSFLTNVFSLKKKHPLINEFTNHSNPYELVDNIEAYFNASSDDDLHQRTELESHTMGTSVSLVDNMMKEEGNDYDGLEDDQMLRNLQDRLVLEIANATTNATDILSSLSDDDNISQDGTSSRRHHQDNDEPPDEHFVYVSEDFIDDDSCEVCSKYVKLLCQCKSMDDVRKDPNTYIMETLRDMHLGEREKGDISGVMKFNSLLGRWFTKVPNKVEAIKKPGSDSRIERGSIVHLHGDDDTFIVLHVSKSNGVKWFPTKETPPWPFVSNFKKEKYRVGLREVKVGYESDNMAGGAVVASIEMLIHDENDDGIDVRRTYRMMPISCIKHLLMKIDI